MRSTPEWIGKTDDQPVPPAKLPLAVLERRILEKMVPEPNSGCWLWTGSATRKGYGGMWNGVGYEKAHRLSYAIYKGDVPKTLHVCHRCDNPYCINPDHLFLGTPKQNTADSFAKGRAVRRAVFGERCHFSKLTEAQVAEIRKEPKSRGSGRRLAKKFGVGESTISLIRSGKQRRFG